MNPIESAAGTEPLTVADSFETTMAVCFEVLLYLNSRMARLKPGEAMEFVTDDPGALEQIPAWCELRGYTLRSATATPGNQWRFVIEKPAEW